MKQRILSICFSLAAAILSVAVSSSARADVFTLHSGGQVRGELLNRDESPRKTYRVKVPGGGEVTLEAAQVKEVKRQSAGEIKYDQVRGDYPDTVAGQWDLAEWCRQNYLTKQRRTHLERIIELDPDHAASRRALGFSKVQGRWVTQEMQMAENGYVRYKNTWVLPQEVELKEQETKAKNAQLEWNAKLRRWHTWLSSDKAAQAIENIKAIDDPFAASALGRMLNESKSDDSRLVRTLFVEALGRLQNSAGMDALVQASLFDHDEEVRLEALDQIVDHNYRPAVARYIKELKNIDNAVINRAAVGLGQLKDPSAIGPLIDSLVTVHTYQVEDAPAGQMSSTFGRGPNGSPGTFSFGGGGPKTVKEQYENREVLQALVILSGGASFNFDRNAWRYWHAAQKKPQSLDARRDDAK